MRPLFLLLVITAITAAPLAGAAAEASGELNVVVTDLESSDGKLRFVIFESKKASFEFVPPTLTIETHLNQIFGVENPISVFSNCSQIRAAQRPWCPSPCHPDRASR